MSKRWTRGELRRREHRAAAIRNLQGLAQMRRERGEVLDREAAARTLDITGDRAGEVALVEVTRAGIGQMRQRRLQCLLRQPDRCLDAPLRSRRQAIPEIGGGP